MKHSSRLALAGAGAGLVAVLLAGCGAFSSEEETPTVNSTTQAATTQQVEPVTHHEPFDPVEDPGLHAEFDLEGAKWAPNGGIYVEVKVTNKNDKPLQKEPLANAKLRVDDGSGEKEVSALNKDQSGVPVGLDHPLGAGSTARLRYAFDTSQAATTHAKFQLANVIWEGNLNN